MRRAVLALVLSVGLVLPTNTGAAVLGKFEGTIDNGGTVKFKLVKNNGKKSVRNWTWEDMPVDCASGGPTSSGFFPFGMRVRQGEFKGAGVLGPPQNPDAVARVRGEINGASANGTFRVSGDIPEGNNCESGKEDWSATRNN